MQVRLTVMGVVSMLAIMCPRPIYAQCQYEIAAVVTGAPDVFGGFKNLILKDMNSSMTAVGREKLDPFGANVPVIWTPGGGVVRYESPYLGSGRNEFLGVNEHGVIVGTFSSAGLDIGLGIVLEGDEVTLLASDVPASYCSARFINDEGVVAGVRDVQRPDGTLVRSAFRWTEMSGFEDLDGQTAASFHTVTGLTEDGTVIGYEGDPAFPGVRPFLWHPDGTDNDLPVPPLADDQWAVSGAINDVGEYTLLVVSPGIVVQPFLATASGFNEINVPRIEREYARHVIVKSLSNYGVAVGGTVYIGLSHPDLSSAPIALLDGTCSRLKDHYLNEPSPRLGGPAFGPADRLDGAFQVLDSGAILATGHLADNEGEVSIVFVPAARPVGDLSGDCVVDIQDVQRLVRRWGQEPRIADLDSDGEVGFSDLLIVLSNWS